MEKTKLKKANDLLKVIKERELQLDLDTRNVFDYSHKIIVKFDPPNGFQGTYGLTLTKTQIKEVHKTVRKMAEKNLANLKKQFAAI